MKIDMVSFLGLSLVAMRQYNSHKHKFQKDYRKNTSAEVYDFCSISSSTKVLWVTAMSPCCNKADMLVSLTNAIDFHMSFSNDEY